MVTLSTLLQFPEHFMTSESQCTCLQVVCVGMTLSVGTAPSRWEDAPSLCRVIIGVPILCEVGLLPIVGASTTMCRAISLLGRSHYTLTTLNSVLVFFTDHLRTYGLQKRTRISGLGVNIVQRPLLWWHTLYWAELILFRVKDKLDWDVSNTVRSTS